MDLKVSPVSYNKAMVMRNNNDGTKTPETAFKGRGVFFNPQLDMSYIGFGLLLLLAIGSILSYGGKEIITKIQDSKHKTEMVNTPTDSIPATTLQE
jgi:hypothetical protein